MVALKAAEVDAYIAARDPARPIALVFGPDAGLVSERADVTVARDAGTPAIEAAVLQLEAVKRALEGKIPKKVIVVPQRIVNVVA